MSKSNVEKYYDALDGLLDRPIAYNPSFRRITSSAVAGIFLSQAWYWSKRHKEDDGWFYKTGKEWEEETGLTRSEQETARKHCARVGVLEQKRKGIPATMYYRVKKERVYELLGLQFAEPQQTGSDDLPKFAEPQQSDGYSNINKETETPPTTPPSIDLEEVKAEANIKVDAFLMLSQSPGMKKQARVDSILSYIGGKLRINATSRKWEQFAKFVDDRQQNFNESVEVFINWLISQPKFDAKFWPPNRMEEFWPQAFAIELEAQKVRLL